MWLESLMIATVLMSSQISSSAGNELNLRLCTNNETVTVQVETKTEMPGTRTTCKCEASPVQTPVMKEDYTYTPGIGSHKLHTEAKTWNEARKICNDEGGHLAIINSREEEAILVNMLNLSRQKITDSATTEVANLGIHDFFKEGEWLTIFGESINSTGYAGWSATYWNGQPDNKNNNQNCGALLYLGGLDDVFCFERLAFFCEMPLSCS